MPYVIDNVVLAMLVDAGEADLLYDLAEGGACLTPSILDPGEQPPFTRRPESEFGRGLWEAQRRPGEPLMDQRVERRTAFYRGQEDGLWQPVVLTEDDLRLADVLTARATRDAARSIDPDYRARRVDPGEAECAAVAINRGWTLWSDDSGIVGLVRALYPDCSVERLCGLLMRAVDEDRLPCEAAAHLYNVVFKEELRLWTTLTLHCVGDKARCVERSIS